MFLSFFLPLDVSIVIDLFLGRNKLSILLEQYFFQSGPNLKARAISRKKKKITQRSRDSEKQDVPTKKDKKCHT